MAGKAQQYQRFLKYMITVGCPSTKFEVYVYSHP